LKKIILTLLIVFTSTSKTLTAAPFEVMVIDSAVDFTHEHLRKYKSDYGVYDVHMDKPLDETKRRLLRFFGEYLHATHVAGIIISHLNDNQENNCLINSAYFVKVGTKVDEQAFQKLELHLNTVKPRVANLSIAESYKLAIQHIIKTNEIEANDFPESILAAHDKIQEIFNRHMNLQNRQWMKLFSNFQDTLFVIAAGNDSRLLSTESYQTKLMPKTWSAYKEELLAGNIPGFKSFVAQIKLPNTITVGSFEGSELTLSNFSNYGNNVVDLLADGEDVNSTLPDGEWGLKSGTSMAAPQVTGLAASILELDLNLSVEQLKEEVFKQTLEAELFKPFSAYGRYFPNRTD
jgi:hypothetical protein